MTLAKRADCHTDKWKVIDKRNYYSCNGCQVICNEEPALPLSSSFQKCVSKQGLEHEAGIGLDAKLVNVARAGVVNT